MYWFDEFGRNVPGRHNTSKQLPKSIIQPSNLKN